MGIPEGTERETGLKFVFNEIIVENFHNMGKELTNEIQDGHKTWNRVG